MPVRWHTGALGQQVELDTLAHSEPDQAGADTVRHLDRLTAAIAPGAEFRGRLAEAAGSLLSARRALGSSGTGARDGVRPGLPGRLRT